MTAPRRPRTKRPRMQSEARPAAPLASVPAIPKIAPAAAAPAALPIVVIDWIEANKAICWGCFWVGWLLLSPGTIIPGAIAVGVGNVFYKERAITLPAVCAAWLGVLAYLALAGALKHSGEINLWLGLSAIFALAVLGKRFPLLGVFLLALIAGMLSGGRRRRW
jgi:hypothetical protein